MQTFREGYSQKIFDISFLLSEISYIFRIIYTQYFTLLISEYIMYLPVVKTYGKKFPDFR